MHTMNSNISSFKGLYIQTAQEYIESLKKNLKEFLHSPSPDTISTLHMDAHSLKSQSTVMQYEKIASLASLMETIFLEAKEKKRALTPHMIEKLESASQKLEESISALKENKEEINLEEVISELQSLTL